MDDHLMNENVEFVIDDESSSVDEIDVDEESVFLVIEDVRSDVENYIESNVENNIDNNVDNNIESNVDTFCCGTCQCTWNDLLGFLEHKKTPCQPNDLFLQPPTSTEMSFDENSSTLQPETFILENSSTLQPETFILENSPPPTQSDEFIVDNQGSYVVGNEEEEDENVIFQIAEEEEEDDELGSNPNPNFPLELDEEEVELPILRHKLACSVCGKNS
jgi:hypothetical protein